MANFCAVVIDNSSPNPMTLVDQGANYALWMQGPEETIPPNSQGKFMLVGNEALNGPNGFVTYTVTDGNGVSGRIKFFFSCPLLESNVVDWAWDPKPDPHPALTAIYCARAGEADFSLGLENVWQDGSVQSEGNPVTAVYFVI